MLKNYLLKFYILLIVALTISRTGFAQNSKIGSWSMVALVLPGDSLNRWGACAEIQVRTNAIISQFQFFEAKGAITYFINKNFTALTGIGKFNTYNLQPGANTVTKETRLYEQLTSNQFFLRLKIEQRLRIEQRWINGLYSNRFRYRLNLFVPLNNTKIEAKTFFSSVSDELFLNNKSPNFERNRAFAGFGYQIDRSWILQAGCFNQYNYQSTGSNDKNYATIIVIYRIHKKHSVSREYMPTTSD